MATSESVNDDDLLHLAASALHESAGVAIEVLEREEDGGIRRSSSDAVVRINGHIFLVEIKSVVDRVDALRNALLRLRKLAEARAAAIEDCW